MVLGLNGGCFTLRSHMPVKAIVRVHACIVSLQVEVDFLKYDKGASAHCGALTPLRPT